MFNKNNTGSHRASSNQSISFVRDLARREGREKNGCFFLEGERAVFELVEGKMRAEVQVRMLVYTDEYVKSISSNNEKKRSFEQLKGKARNSIVISPNSFASISETVTPQGIGAVINFPKFERLTEIMPGSNKILVLENIQDPGNLGTCIRTADAFGFDAVICTTNCCDMFNPKVTRSTVGSIFHIPVYYINPDINAVLSILHDYNFTVLAAHPRGGLSISDSACYSSKNAIIIGNEGAGLSEKAKVGCDKLVTIPMKGMAESLNAGIAAAVMMYEVMVRSERK